jgi:hypothetical protein
MDSMLSFQLKTQGRVWRKEANQWPNSYVFVCQHCGEVWARARAENVSEWLPLRLPCERCGSGSLWLSWDKEYCAALPREILLREVALLTKELPRE